MGLKRTATTLKKNMFLFRQLTYRDFQQKYKRTFLGMAWSVLSPLLTLLIMRIIFKDFFGRDMPHYTIYLFAGNINLAYFKEATKGGMSSLMHNSKILSKINVPKYLFLLSKNVSSFINYILTVAVFFFFCVLDRIDFGWHMLSLVYPVFCLVILNIGMGMILSCLFVFFRDTAYLYDVFLTLLTYLSAIFYTLDRFPESTQRLFLLNPVYVIIKYFRVVVIDGDIPSLAYHALCLGYSLLFLAIGSFMYKRYNHKFVYYF